MWSDSGFPSSAIQGTCSGVQKLLGSMANQSGPLVVAVAAGVAVGYVVGRRQRNSDDSPVEPRRPYRPRTTSVKPTSVDANLRLQGIEHAKRVEEAQDILLDLLSEHPSEDLEFAIEIFNENAVTAAAASATTLLQQATPKDAELRSWIANNYSPFARALRNQSQSRNKSSISTRTSSLASSRSGSMQPPDSPAGNGFPTLSLETQTRMQQLLLDSSAWHFDIFQLNTMTEKQPLVYLGHHLMEQMDIVAEFKIDRGKLSNFLYELSDMYGTSNPYHNHIHAADVLQTTYFLITNGLGKYLTKLDVFSAFVAAMVHDVDHPGLNNAFLVTTESELAARYNDQSVLENHHCSVAFRLLNAEQCDITSTLSATQKQEFRQNVISMVLGTDMAKHFEQLASFKSWLSARKAAVRDELSSRSSLSGLNWTNDDLPIEKKDRQILLDVAIHCADLSNPTRPWHVSKEWADHIMEEFWMQGDRERSMSLPISAFYDRKKPAKAKCQTGFIDYIVKPLFAEWQKLFPAVSTCLEHLESNRDKWVEIGETGEEP